MDSQWRTTIKHSEIRSWTKRHGGRPQKIVQPDAKAAIVGLRLDFPGKKDEVYLGEAVERLNITWKEFFEIFEREKLGFLYEERKRIGVPMNAYRFIKREGKRI